MKIKNKGKVHPSPSSSSSSSSSAAAPPPPILAILQLLPVTVLALASSLPPPDQEVLSYLLARSLLLSSDAKPSSSSSSAAHGSPTFDCGCFDCYTIYWLRWDSSPNRDLIHRVIDDFEDHLSSSSSSSSSNGLVGKGKVRGARGCGRRAKDKAFNRMDTSSQRSGDNGGGADGNVGGSPRDKKGDDQENDGGVEMQVSSEGSPLAPPRPASPVSRSGGGGEHKGLARKVLPDVLGILNSRLWNLWSPNV
ncbi:hypothetical protein MLD38_008492 [Melastoma candidum]|uniref:Uncharacterized protein n=1 Tax=Melastoma candidum TaxID=119954 RepID=A0ACB9RUN8_9MYRT|nr:hypothetical protein MLD38_008492 [Melastoma candidum]